MYSLQISIFIFCMPTKVLVDFGNNKFVELSIQHGMKGTDMISFFDEKGEEYISEKLSLYSIISVDHSNNLKITLSNEQFKREIMFESENDSSDFWKFVQNHAKLTVTSMDDRKFLMKFDNTQQSGIKQYVSPAMGFINKKISSTFKAVKGFVAGAQDLDDSEVKEISNGINLGYLTRSISETEMIEYKEGESQKISNAIIDQEQIMKLWCSKLKTEKEKLEDYNTLSIQWKTLTKDQWNLSLALRSFTKSAESAIEASDILSKDPFNQLAFNILISCIF